MEKQSIERASQAVDNFRASVVKMGETLRMPASKLSKALNDLKDATTDVLPESESQARKTETIE